MKRIQFDQYGGPEHMSFAEYTLPNLASNRVRIRVKAAALNPLDWKLRQGAMKFATGRKFPQGMGSDFAGIIEEIGEHVKDFKVGDEVFGTLEIRRQGAFAEIVDADSELICLKPKSLSFSEAACLPIPAATAWNAIVNTAKVTSGMRIFINGCSGAVGNFAIQIALNHGADISGTCGEKSIENIKASGVHSVYQYTDKFSFISNGPYDVVFDTLGTLPVTDGLEMLLNKGKFIDINPTIGRVLRGIASISKSYKMVFATGGFKNLSDIEKLATQGNLHSSIGLEVPFTEALDVIRNTEQGQRILGRVILLM
ncbi:hypothetical protein F892_02359 [Acinetobacter vivianii]|uniref:Enoyl reductase (ER) domain-containing protein n=1 Tax=Acinetobacter vivianii TaxID=1776742 RepID=N9PZI7_9GAMM|nr:NAD(P)-dependent alcohol dehydrogenase [Acinetobacter vivianii]ENX23116.1 hypothetical protein F892_02359 [Acinetobacter vivianii]GGI60569.1 alcohol dehydrogenase [Acinetobacter vivianii]